MHVALLGGSFNPPHVGHLLVAQFVRATEPVDEVWLVPSFRHPFGKPLEAFEHRVKMCQLLCADTAGWLSVSQVEKEIDGEGRTVDTLERLTVQFPGAQFTWIVGSDILPDLPHWKNVPRIRELSRVLVVNRAGHPAPEAVGPPLVAVSSTEIRERLARGETPSHWVPRTVLEYIRTQRLYGL